MDLAEFRLRRVARQQSDITADGPTEAEFYFDLASPFAYLAAERVERTFTTVRWIPASARMLGRGAVDVERERANAAARAAALRLPLVWPERWPNDVPAAMRAASYAGEQDRAAAFVIAACRLAWAGGFDLEDPQVLAEAAAAASLSVEGCLRAAQDAARDVGIEDAGRRIAAAGADRLPAFVVGRALFAGEERIAEAAAFARQPEAEGA